MSFNPFIYDSSFRVSPILSYGKAASGTIWPKILAILAGILVVFGLMFAIWLWFFSQIPIPRNAVVQIILPANQSISSKAPLEWKQVQQLNKPMPTLAGMINNGTDRKFEAYAIRLSFIEALFTDKSIWQVNSASSVSEVDYQTPYMIFGWPWELINQETWLSLDVKQIFAYRNISIEDLPGTISGNVIGNEWQTNFTVSDDFSALDFVQSNNNPKNFVLFSSIYKSVLLNYFTYQGVYIDLSKDYSLLEWDSSAENQDLRLFDSANFDIFLATTTFFGRFTKPIDYVLPDGDQVQRLYLSDQTTSTIVSSYISTSTELIGEGLIPVQESVSNLTCSGKIMARFDYPSIQNICSWVDICFEDWDELLFVSRDGKLVVCGY